MRIADTLDQMAESHEALRAESIDVNALWRVHGADAQEEVNALKARVPCDAMCCDAMRCDAM